jgi:glucosyl-3-phosphoglycerate synthase
VCVPARNEVDTIGSTVGAIVAAGVADAVLVLDNHSSDATPGEAARAGATVIDVATLRPEAGEVLGKGDAMWRGLALVETDCVAFVDADLGARAAHFAAELAAPLRASPAVQFVKGRFRRVVADEGIDLDGGRVTELVARPLINLFAPQLARFYQPLSGQVAARTELLRAIPFMTGFAVEIAMLLDVVQRLGAGPAADAVVEADLGALENRERSLSHLAVMAQEVTFGFLARCPGIDDALRPQWSPYRRIDAFGNARTAPNTVALRPPLD